MLPSACFVDGLTPPHACRAVEVEEDAGARAAAVLKHKVTVQQDGLDLSHEIVIAVQVSPARLYHADARLGEMMDNLPEPVWRRHEVGVEDSNQLAAGDP